MKAAREAAKISFFDTKDYVAAVAFYRYMVLYSSDSAERLDAQRRIAQILYEHLADYKSAIPEFYRLLDLPHSDQEAYDYRFSIAKSYYFMNNFFQARAELDTLLGRNLTADQRFEVLLLRANVYLAMKRMDDAILAFQKVIDEFPDRSRKESVALNLAVCYEEQKKFAEAIQVLKTVRNDYPTPEFIDLRVKRLQERQSYLPGAKGLKK